MKIFIIGAVRNADAKWKEKLELYTKALEANGHTVHLPHRDTNQNLSSIEICTINKNAIIESDEIHLFYIPESQGTHFDMGMSFALNKKLRVISSPEINEGKSFNRLAHEWEEVY